MVLSPALPIPQLKRQKLVKKVEVQSDQVTIYLDQVRWVIIAAVLRALGWWDVAVPHPRVIPQLTKEEETFSFAATQDFPVRNLQPATVMLYDYYETGELLWSPKPDTVHTDQLWLVNGSSSLSPFPCSCCR